VLLTCHPNRERKRSNLARLSESGLSFHIGFSAAVENLRWVQNISRTKPGREWWSIHIEAWQRSGVSQAEYCRQHRLAETTFTRWLQHLAGEEAARKLTKYQTELRREKRREEREKGLKRRQRQRNSVSTDVRNRGTQAFWAMHVEAMNWSGMGVREYAAALRLSPYALRKSRDRLDEREVAIDWRAHLHPSARPFVGTSAKEPAPESSLTGAANEVPQAPAMPARRFFSDETERSPSDAIARLPGCERPSNLTNRKARGPARDEQRTWARSYSTIEHGWEVRLTGRKRSF